MTVCTGPILLVIVEAKLPLFIWELSKLLIAVSEEGSDVVVILETVLLAGRDAASMIVLTIVDPEKTPTTFTREVSVICSKAQRLLMKLVMALLEKKVLISMEKCVVSEMESTIETTAVQSGASVRTNSIVLFV